MRLWEASARAGFEPLLPAGHEFPEPQAERFAATLADEAVATLVAEEGAELLAYTSCGASRDDDVAASTAEIRTFFVSPDAWGRRIGRRLMDAVFDELRGRGYRDVTVWSFTANDRANRFYDGCGFARDGAEMLVEEGFAGLPAARYRRPLT